MKYKFYHRIGNLNKNNIEEILSLIVDPKVNLVPTWMLNRRLDFNTADSFHVVSTIYESLIREDHDRLITMKTNRGLRYLRGLKIKGQHTKSNGRKGKSVGVQRKKKK
uniref:Ribosomal protein S18 n=1 Tax=Amorphochlora amoebiformis TaxID=1561963 RepID=A0A0H5BI17_9EUKA|nr:ribosomal protein S18 [Amorphochlora amoebiformis]